jgi:hypothetical protein
MALNAIPAKGNLIEIVHSSSCGYGFIWLRMLDVKEVINEKNDGGIKEFELDTEVARYRIMDHKCNEDIR